MIASPWQTEVQEASFGFFGPLTVAYAAAIGVWWLATALWPRAWPSEHDASTGRPWLDLAVAALVVVAVLGVGQLYHHDLLLPRDGLLSYTANQLIIYAPLFVALALRGQGGETVWVTWKGLGRKLLFGLGLGLLATAVFLTMRGELDTWPDHMARTIAPRSLAHLFPVFMEGVAVAFLFVRLRWAFGRTAALLVPAVLFAGAHVPGAVADGATAAEITAFFVYNTAFVALIVAALSRGRDVIWIGVVHYLMDVPSGAF